MTWGDLPFPLLLKITETTKNSQVLEELCDIKHSISIKMIIFNNNHITLSVIMKLLKDDSEHIRAWAEDRLYYFENNMKWNNNLDWNRAII